MSKPNVQLVKSSGREGLYIDGKLRWTDSFITANELLTVLHSAEAIDFRLVKVDGEKLRPTAGQFPPELNSLT